MSPQVALTQPQLLKGFVLYKVIARVHNKES